MNPRVIPALALALSLPLDAGAQLLGVGSGGPDRTTLSPVTVTARPDAHWNFRSEETSLRVRHYSPNLDGVGFANQGADGKGACYGHSLLSTRWFQYIVKPIKSGTISSITSDEFRDFWGGRMDYPPAYTITAANVDGERLQPYSVYDQSARIAVGKLVGYYHEYQLNLFDHHRETFASPLEFVNKLKNTIRDQQLPPQLSLRNSEGGGHAVDAYRVERGTATYDNRDGDAGVTELAWKVHIYDPNAPGNGDAASDTTYQANNYLIVFPGSGSLVGFSEQDESAYSDFLRQSSTHDSGTWHIPQDQLGIRKDVEDDSGEIRSWHLRSVSTADARKISGVDPIPQAD